MRLLATAVCLMALSGCSTMPSPVPTVPRPKPAAEMVPCQPLPLLAGPSASDLARWILDSAEIYSDCAANHRRLKEWINDER